MALQSQLFRADTKLEAAAVSDPAHILPGATGPHVGKIQLALIELDGAPIAQDSAYGPSTAAAVRAFKQERRILNLQGKIDDIVGKKTIAALDTEMLAVEKRRGSRGGGLLGFKVDDLPFVDFVVRFRAGSFKSATENIDQTEYRKKTNRRLVPIDSRTNVGDASLINVVIKKIDDELKDPSVQRGIICINGNSAGGRNALELAAALKGKHPIKFVGIADAALFGNLFGMNRPRTILPFVAINNPVWQTPPLMDAEIKHNFFQGVDNKVGGSPFAPVWTSNSPIGEIHGELLGFQINQEISIPFGQRGLAHDIAGDEGDRRNGATISRLLGAL